MNRKYGIYDVLGNVQRGTSTVLPGGVRERT
jgi:hypothetical protein